MPRVTLTAPDGVVLVEKNVNFATARHIQRIAAHTDDAAIARMLGEQLPQGSSDAEVAEASAKIAAKLEGLGPREQREVLREVRRMQLRDERRVGSEVKELRQKRDKAVQLKEAYEELHRWLPAQLVLERPGGSVLHHLRQEILDGTAHVYRGLYDKAKDDYETELFLEAMPFVVWHDWAAAFAGGGDYEHGLEFRLPFEVCVFEFKVSGRSAVMICADVDGQVWEETAVRGPTGWVILGHACRFEGRLKDEVDGEREPLSVVSNFLRPQIKAICVALEAEVATSEVVRAPHKLNRARERSGKAPLKDYHVVSLARRTRVLPSPAAADGEHGKRRLHFRRGHWRHYPAFKTWIRWTLVGNPDLGFVDKEYRL